MKKLKLHPYIQYHLRWQSGILFTWPAMYLLKDVMHLGNAVTIICFQFIGACLYWFVDKWIFKKKEQKIKYNPGSFVCGPGNNDYGRRPKNISYKSQFKKKVKFNNTKHK